VCDTQYLPQLLKNCNPSQYPLRWLDKYLNRAFEEISIKHKIKQILKILLLSGVTLVFYERYLS